jgi:Cu2+-exporting ATPase
MSVQTAIPEALDTQAAGDAFPIEQTTSLAVENMHCGGCLRSVEKALAAVPGVFHARANLSARRVSIRFDPEKCAEDAFVAALANAGFKAAPMQAEADADTGKRERDYLRRVGVAGFAAANIMLLSVAVWSGAGDMDAVTREFLHRLSALIALPAIVYAGQPFFTSALSALKARRLNMDVPISLAVILATGMSCFQMLKGSNQVYFDAAITLLFFLLIGRWLDQRLRTRAQSEAQNLLSLQSGLATLIDARGEQRSVPAHALVPGDKVLIAAGERVPADGIVISGGGDIDHSLITGESDPVSIGKGDQIYAGTLNLSHALTLKVTAADDMTLLAEIGKLMANAEQGRASYRRLADRAAQIYAPAVHILGAVTFIGWFMLGAGWEVALTTAIAVLIITCPCALALAVPAVQIAAASRLFRNGIILKTSDALERLAEVDCVIFDKTGTLTLGRPVLLNMDEISDDTLAAAARLAAASRHPYAKALVEAARARLGMVEAGADVEETPGEGLKRHTSQGEERLGSPAWCGVTKSEAASLWYRAPGGETTAFRFKDTLRPDADETVEKLRAQGFDLALLSGDRARAVEEAANAVGIADWRGQVKPADKIAAIKRHAQHHKVLMVGDGLNDAPALAQAHVSMSPASAADITQRAADLVFQGDRLSPIIEAITIAVRARALAFQNFAIALAYNALFVPLAMAGYVTPLLAAIAMSTSSILVTANALRLSSTTMGKTS